MQFTGQKPLDPLTLIVSLDDNGTASGRLYEDAGDGFGYKQGLYRLTEFTVKKSGKGYKFSSKRFGGSLSAVERTVEIFLLNRGNCQTYRLNAASQSNTANEVDLQ
jgi:alpha-glucosidase